MPVGCGEEINLQDRPAWVSDSMEHVWSSAGVASGLLWVGWIWAFRWAVVADGGSQNGWWCVHQWVMMWLLPIRDQAVWRLVWNFSYYFFFFISMCQKQGCQPKHQFRSTSGASFSVLVLPWAQLLGHCVWAGGSYALLPMVIQVHSYM